MAQRMQIFISGKSRCSQSHSSDAVIAWWGWGFGGGGASLNQACIILPI